MVFAVMLAAGASVAAAPAGAETPCGTIVIPPGLGVAPPTAITGLHPLLGSSLYNQQVANVLYRQLLYIDPEHHVDPVLSIAAHIDVLGGGSGFHVTLKPWLWSDGEPITADDVLYGFELIRHLGQMWGGFGTADFPDVVKDLHVDGLHDFTVTLTHKVNPDAFIINALPLLIPLPRHVWGTTSSDEMWQRQSDPTFFRVVSGPYHLGRFEMARYLTLEVNPLYGGPKPSIAKIVVNFIEGTSEIRALQSGEVDAANLQFSVWDAARKLPGFDLVTLPPADSFDYFGLNFRNPSTPDFGDVRVRQAIADAIDQRLIIKLVFHGSGDESHELLPAEPASDLSPAVRAGTIPVGYDPARARALLAAAGWTQGGDGILQKDGRRFSFTLNVSAGRDQQSALAQIAQRNLAAVGIDMHINEISFDQIITQINGDPAGWEAVMLGWTETPYIDGLPLFGTGGVNNNVGYSDPEMDRLGAAINAEPGNSASYAFQDYVVQQQPVIFVPAPRYAVLARHGIEGLQDALSPLNTWAPEYLRLTGPLACTDAHSHQPS